MQSVDSLSAHEFQVEVDGQVIKSVFSVRGLMAFNAAGGLSQITVGKMVEADPETPFNAWARATQAGEQATRDLSIVAMDEGVETRRWVYKGASIVQITYSAFDTASSELVEEALLIQASEVEVVWPV